jgi:ABC-type lipoprotein release transport system permease subunit
VEGVALGAALADRVGAKFGTRLFVAGQPQRVTVLPTVGSADDAKAFRPLQAARRAIGIPDAATELRVQLWPGARVEDVRARLANALPGATVLRVDRGSVADVELESTIRNHHLGVVVASALATLACLALASFLDASERRLELASLVAFGASPWHVVVVIASRSAAIAAQGAGAGSVAAGAAAAWLGDAAAIARAILPVAATSVTAAALLGVAASLPTALAAAARDPIGALQESA